MLEITNIRDGAILDHNDGIETDDYLEIKVDGKKVSHGFALDRHGGVEGVMFSNSLPENIKKVYYDGNEYYLCIDCHEGMNKEYFESKQTD